MTLFWEDAFLFFFTAHVSPINLELPLEMYRGGPLKELLKTTFSHPFRYDGNCRLTFFQIGGMFIECLEAL